MNGYLRNCLPTDYCFICYHDDQDDCDCRKTDGPDLRAAERYGIDLEKSVLIEDRWRDIDAGHAAGCRTIPNRPLISRTRPTNTPYARVSVEDAVE